MNHHEDERRSAGLEPVSVPAGIVVARLRDRLASRTKTVIVTAARRDLLPRWLATAIISRTGRRGA